MQHGDREWITVIQAVNSTGWAVPLYIVIAGRYYLSLWYDDNTIPKDWRIRTSPNGWKSNEIGLDFIQYFEKHTKDRKTGVHRLLVLDGHESHVSGDFELYCKEYNIIILRMPAHSSHILQPLDVACFGPFKRVYGKMVEKMMRRSLTHIAKENFLPLFKDTFFEVFIHKNIQAGFWGAGLVFFWSGIGDFKAGCKITDSDASKVPWNGCGILGIKNTVKSDRGAFTVYFLEKKGL
jgi:hypothetical protein